MSLPKILLAAPTSNVKDYCFDAWADGVQNLDYPRYSVLLVDNSHDPTYYHKILDRGIQCIHVEPQGNVVDYITECQNLIRYIAITGGYDYLFSLESDVFPSRDIIIQLLRHDKPIVTAPYYVQYKGGDPSICWTDALTQHFGKYSYLHSQMVGTQETLHRLTGELVKVFGCGIGCTMIHTEVLKAIEFRADIRDNESRSDRSVFSDSLFYVDCMRNNIPVYLDTSLLVEHRYGGWDANIDLYK